MQRTGAGGEAPHVQYKEFLECVFFLCRRYYHGHYRTDMVCWLKILKNGAKRPVRNANPSLNCLDTGRNYLRYLSQTYEEYIHVLAWILTMNTTVVAIEVHSITTCILFNQSALYFIVYVTVAGQSRTMLYHIQSANIWIRLHTGVDWSRSTLLVHVYNSNRNPYSLFLMSTIIIASWNATGIMSSASYANNFLKKESIQVLGLSEHWLYRHSLHCLQAIHNSSNCFGVCNNALNTPSNRRVGKGGVAILWHRSLDNQVSPLDIDSDRICGIQYRVSPNIHYYILQVYAPCSNHPIQEFRDFIDYLYVIISMYWHNGVVVVMGDFNAHLQGNVFIKPTDDRGRYLIDMMDSFNLSTNVLRRFCEFCLI